MTSEMIIALQMAMQQNNESNQATLAQAIKDFEREALYTKFRLTAVENQLSSLTGCHPVQHRHAPNLSKSLKNPAFNFMLLFVLLFCYSFLTESAIKFDSRAIIEWLTPSTHYTKESNHGNKHTDNHGGTGSRAFIDTKHKRQQHTGD